MEAQRQAAKKPDKSEDGENVGAESRWLSGGDNRFLSARAPFTVSRVRSINPGLLCEIARPGRVFEQIADGFFRVLLHHMLLEFPHQGFYIFTH